MIADFHQYYGIDLATDTHSPRYLLTLIEQLPPESRTMAALQGGHQFRGWGVSEYIQASLVDAVQENSWITAAASSKSRPPRPKPFYRPASGSRKKSNQFTQTVVGLMKAKKNRES